MKRILLIEDNADTLGFYCYAARGAGFEPVGCATGTEGVEAFRAAFASQAPFDLVITDLMLDAQSSGVSVIREIRQISQECRIVLATGRQDDHILFLMKEIGILAVWHKPIPNFAARVQEVFAMPQNITSDRRTSFIRRGFQVLNDTKQGTLILVVLFMVVALQIRSTWMAPRLYGNLAEIKTAQEEIGRKLDGAVSTATLPAGYRVTVPEIKSGFKVLKNGTPRMIIEFEAKDAAAAESLASLRGKPFWVRVTREK